MMGSVGTQPLEGMLSTCSIKPHLLAISSWSPSFQCFLSCLDPSSTSIQHQEHPTQQTLRSTVTELHISLDSPDLILAACIAAVY